MAPYVMRWPFIRSIGGGEMAGLKPDHLGSIEWKRTRLVVLRRDQNICAYCGDVATQVDHVVPRVDGGSDALDNLVASCRRCNLLKGRRSVFLMGRSTPLASSDNLSHVTTTSVPNGPFDGQPEAKRGQ